MLPRFPFEQHIQSKLRRLVGDNSDMFAITQIIPCG